MKHKSREFRLDQTISSADPTRLDATRKVVHEEIQEAREAVAEAERKSNPPGVVVEEATPEPQSIDDQRLEKMDLITDVQLILVGRFQRLFKAVIAAITLLCLCLAAMVVGVVTGLQMQGQVGQVVADQKAMMEEQAKANEEQAKIAKQVKDTSEKVKETKDKVEEVADKVPEIEVDPKTGKKTVLLPTKAESTANPNTMKTAKPPGPKPPPGVKVPKPRPKKNGKKIRVEVDELK